MRLRTFRFFAVLSGLILGAAGLASASIHDDAIRVSGDLQAQLQSDLDKVFGKSRSSALVRVELELDPELQSAIKKTYLNPGYKAKTADSSGPEFLWNQEKTDPDSYVLPGFQAKKKTGPQTLEREDRPDPGLVLAAGVRVKRIVAKLSLDRRLPADSEKIAASLARGYLAMDPGRGDVLTVERVDMPTIWQRFLANPEHYDGLIKNIILALLVVGAFFVFLTAIDRFGKILRRAVELIAAAWAAKPKPVEPEVATAVPFRNGERKPGELGQESGSEGEPEALEGPADLVIDVPIEKVGRLVKLLQREQAENIALVVPYLKEEVRYAFLSLLPQEKSVEALASLAEARYVEPEVAARLKAEIEARVQNTIGGIDQVVDLIRNARPAIRKQLLDLLRQRRPEMFGEIRPQVLLFEDLRLLEDLEWQLVLPAVKMNDLALALCGQDGSGDELTAELMERVKRNFPTKTRQIFEETLSFQNRVSKEQVFESRDRIVSVLQALIEERKVGDPLQKLRSDPRLLDAQSQS